MKYSELSASKNKIVSIFEKDGETIVYQGKFKNAPKLGEVDVLSISEYGLGLAIVIDQGKTKEEKAEARKELRKSTDGLKRRLLYYHMMFGGMCNL